MARIVPSDITPLALSGAHRHELDTLRLLQRALPDAYTVFHGVHWAREFQGDTVFGEVDFVVVNQSGKVLVIEQKTGTLDETGDDLVARYADGTKSVTRQLHRALDHIREKFRRAQGGRASIELDYVIYCPEHRIVRVNAAGLDPGRIVDAASRDSLAERIAGLLGAGDPARAEWAARVLAFFRQTFDLVPDIHAHVAGQEKAFTRLSGGLVKLLAGIEMRPLRLRISGTAGSGKSVISRCVFDQAVARGACPLLVCFNRALMERLKVAVSPGGLVATWYGLCDLFLRERGQPVDFAHMRTDPRFWETVAERVIGEHVPEAWKFDTLIVDEGQDFRQEWLDILGLFLREPHDILWLEDPDQSVRGQAPVRLDGFVGFRAPANFRSPRSIARFIERMLPFEFECANDLPGLGVGVTPYADPGEQPALVARIVAGLLAQGFAHDDIVILTTHHTVTPGTPRSVLGGRERVGNYRLRQFTGEYDLLGNQLTTPGQLTFSSIGRFKGQQSPAVIVVDVDPDPADTDGADRLLFAGMTRATVRLELPVRQGNPLAERVRAAR